MNAHSRFATDTRTDDRARDRSPVRAVIALAKRFDRHPYVAAPDRSQCFDCVTLINLLADGDDVPESWMQEGGRLPFRAIDPPDARPGDLITFSMPWRRSPYHAALLVRGDGVDDARAQIFGPWLGHAAATCWLRAWRPYVTGAWRIPAVDEFDSSTAAAGKRPPEPMRGAIGAARAAASELGKAGAV